MATIEGSWYRSGRLRRGSVAAAFVLAQLVAVAAAYRAGRPTLYALFLVFSTAATAYAVEHDGGTLLALVRFLVVQAVALGVAVLAERGVALATTGRFEVGFQLWALLLVGFAVPGLLYVLRRAGNWSAGAVGVVGVVLLSATAAFVVGGGFAIFLPLWGVLYVVLGAVAVAYTLRGSLFTVATATLGSVLMVALGLPLALFVARQAPSVVVEKALDPNVHRMLYLGIYGPLLAALLSLVCGIPLAHLLGRGFTGQALVESLVDLPLVVPHSVAGIIILFGFGRGGAFPGVPVLGTVVGMVLAMTFVSAPYAVNATREAFEAIDDRLAYASRIHGANRWQTFRRVTAPLAVRGIVTGGVLAWARAVSEFGAVAVVAYTVDFFYPLAGESVRAQHAPVFVYNTYLQGGLTESGAVAFLLLGVSALIFLVVRWLTGDTGGVLG